jgi:hypothetical protein
MGKPKLHRVKLVHNSFSGHPIRIQGEKVVQMNFDGHCTQSQLLVGYKNRNYICDRHWINA